MSRKPRYYSTGIPCHVISRGNDRNTCFFEDEDYQFYLECLHFKGSESLKKEHASVFQPL